MSSINNRNRNNLNNKNTKSSGTGKSSTMLGLPTKSSLSQENSKNQNVNNKNAKNNNKNKNSNNEIITNKSLPELLKENEEMQIKLTKINSEMDKERNLLMQETSELNNDITDRGFEISCLTTENKNLISQLKDIKTSLDDKMKISKIFLVKMQQLEKSEKNLKKKIEVLDKEIESAQKNNIIAQKDCKRIKLLEKNNEEGKEKILNEELKALQQTKLELENNNFNLRKTIKEHKQCPKIKSNLISKLNLLNNSYEFELKKTNMLETSLLDLDKKKEKIKQEIKEKEEFNANNRSISYSKKIRKDVLKQMDKKNSEKKMVNSSARLLITEICNNIEEQNIKNSGNIKKTSNTNYKKEPKTLFTETEQMQLANIIPPSFLNEFKERFELIENQRFNLFKELKKNKSKYNDQSGNIQIKLNYTELKKKEQKMQWVDMNSNLSKKNVDINKLKNEIKKVNREYNNWNKLLKMKNNENIRLNQYMTNIKQTGNMNMSNEENNYNGNNKNLETDKHGSLYEKQNNIKLFYRNKKNV